MDNEKIIKRLEEAKLMLTQAVDRGGEMAVMGAFKCLNSVTDALTLLKEQEAIIEQYHKADGFLDIHGWKWETNE